MAKFTLCAENGGVMSCNSLFLENLTGDGVRHDAPSMRRGLQLAL